MSMSILERQTRLADLGFDPGPLDGKLGPLTEGATTRFKKSIGFKARPLFGRLTEAALRAAQPLPWMREINRVLGLHEVYDNGALSKWLASDGAYLGDPSGLPWCGDAVATALRLGVPGIKVPDNPYWARNWAGWANKADGIPYGAIVSFKRGSGGHVAFAIGINADRTKLYIRGGNQDNEINDTWIAMKDRFIDARWPDIGDFKQRPVPILAYDGRPLSVNEA